MVRRTPLRADSSDPTAHPPRPTDFRRDRPEVVRGVEHIRGAIAALQPILDELKNW
jgi:hypothetical protein